MKQVLVRREGVQVAVVPAPLVEPGHVLVEVAHSLISAGTEVTTVMAAKTTLLQRAMSQPDKVLQIVDHIRKSGIKKTVAKVDSRLQKETAVGYSCSGMVLQVGEGVTDFARGDLVACVGGGIAVHAEIVLVPRNLVVKIPEGCDTKAAASVALGAIAMQGVRRAEAGLGDVVAVIGLGLLGQITVQLLKAAGCHVIGADIDARRVQLASELGADHVLKSSDVDVANEVKHLTNGHGVDRTIITASSSSNAIVQQAMQITRKKGRVVLVGSVGLGLQRSPFYEKELDFVISTSYGPGRYDDEYERRGADYPYAYVRWTENRNMGEYLKLVAEKRISLDRILEREYDVADAAKAYEDLSSGEDKPVGIVLRYGQNGHEKADDKTGTRVWLRATPVTGKLNIALIGAGNFATSMHLPNMQQLSDLFHVLAVVSRTGSNSAAVARRAGAEYASTNYEDVLADPDVQAVLITTRHNLHAGQVLAALAAGKHVFVEKPLCLSMAELTAIAGCYGFTVDELVAGKQVAPTSAPILMVGFNRRFAPAVKPLKALLSSRQNPLVAVYRVNASYMPVSEWVHGPEGGGRLAGEGCHMIDLMGFLTGARVTDICANAIVPATEHVLSTDNVIVSLGYEDGSIGTLIYSSLGHSDLGKEHLQVNWDGKSAILDDYKSLHISGLKGKDWASSTADKGHKEGLEAFGRAIKSHGTWPIPLWQLIDSTSATIRATEQIMPGRQA